jgi:Tol biopolymer transport system component
MLYSVAPSHAGNIAFTSDRDHVGSHEIYVMRDYGSAQTRLTYNMGDCRTPAISPDGRKIAFAAPALSTNSYYNSPSYDIFVMNINGSGLQRLTGTPHQDLHPT